MAVDGGDDRDRDLLPHPRGLLTEVGDAPVGQLARVAVALPRRLVATGHLLERAEVEPGAERRPLAREHHSAHGALRLQLLAHLGEGDEHRAVEGVALVGSVEAHVGDAPLDGAGHAIGHGRSLPADLRHRPSG